MQTFFCNKVVTIWNTLPNNVVLSESLNVFKNSLDKLWRNQDLLTDYRSCIDKKIYQYHVGDRKSHVIYQARYDQPIEVLYLRAVTTLSK